MAILNKIATQSRDFGHREVQLQEDFKEGALETEPQNNLTDEELQACKILSLLKSQKFKRNVDEPSPLKPNTSAKRRYDPWTDSEYDLLLEVFKKAHSSRNFDVQHIVLDFLEKQGPRKRTVSAVETKVRSLKRNWPLIYCFEKAN